MEGPLRGRRRGETKGKERRELTLYGLTIGKLPEKYAQIEKDIWEYIFALRDQLRRKYEYDSDDQLTIPQVSAVIYIAVCYQRERILQQRLHEMDGEAISATGPKSILHDIQKTSCTRHGALNKLGLSEKDAGTGFPFPEDDEDEE